MTELLTSQTSHLSFGLVAALFSTEICREGGGFADASYLTLLTVMVIGNDHGFSFDVVELKISLNSWSMSRMHSCNAVDPQIVKSLFLLPLVIIRDTSISFGLSGSTASSSSYNSSLI